MSAKDQRDARTYAIIGAAMEVHKRLGCGFLEAVYQEALAVEFRLRGIPFEREVQVPIVYKGVRLNTAYRVDYLCYGSVQVELKALEKLSSIEESQTLNYLYAGECDTALLINFGAESLEYRRYVGKRAIPSVQSV